MARTDGERGDGIRKPNTTASFKTFSTKAVRLACRALLRRKRKINKQDIDDVIVDAYLALRTRVFNKWVKPGNAELIEADCIIAKYKGSEGGEVIEAAKLIKAAKLIEADVIIEDAFSVQPNDLEKADWVRAHLRGVVSEAVMTLLFERHRKDGKRVYIRRPSNLDPAAASQVLGCDDRQGDLEECLEDLLGLSELQREILLLRLQSCTHPEIADKLNLAIHVIKAEWADIKQILADIIKPS